ncbi:cytochrome P450 monooxygenase TRI13 [Colletotrichum spaethianum]|uniref:Cytochrome P450 monooxygenase TRI13 n=1 Tax=Colletotrichum spaethianum TaxID=700344 RepID=A0AA37L7E4_9PEZI|nr:cytochrome P450 monooxygenase TRI13 [Colletotrichum spaethianum]GKT41028.1 cytochrome P450 monooxygenase TRI13 [Colletotrichum spaethianum]
MLGTVLPGRTLGDEKVVEANLVSPTHALCFAVAGLLFYVFYRWALPKPIPGIPHNAAAPKHILGDIPSLKEGIDRTGEFALWLLDQSSKLNSPLFQVLIRPLGKPIVVMTDFRETQDMLMRRKDFDRSSLVADLLEGAGRKHHIHMKTGPEWKQHRRLLQDLMSPQFLNEVAAPTVYSGVLRLVKLWSDKARIADGRPFAAETDIYYGALDAVTSFVFGGSFPHSAIRPTMELVEALGDDDVVRLRDQKGVSNDVPVDFPEGQCDEKLKATFDVAHSIEYLQGSPIPRIKWWFVKKLPSMRKTFQIKMSYTQEEIAKALKRLQEVGNEESKALSAVELIVLRERKLAENEGREPDYFSETMIDEVFGVVVAGHDTTSTTMCWGVKLLADNPQTQTTLRDALRSAFSDALAENRSPSVDEISGTKIPYLDAAMEEILRCGGAAPMVDREAVCDTELLGHHIPKGTVVLCLNKGPSMMKPALAVDEAKRSKSSQSAKARAWDDADIGQFKPERWLVEPAGSTDGAVEFDQQAGPQLAFGLGTRGCFGRRLAYLELRIILTLIVWNFELLPCPKALSGYGAREGLTYKPKDCYVRLSALGAKRE